MHDSDELLRETYQLAKDNNRRLRKIQRSMTISMIFRIMWWAFIIGVPIVLYYYVFVPYTEQLSEQYEGFQESVLEFPGLGDIFEGFRDNAPRVP